MIIEIIITSLMSMGAVYILYRNIKKKSSGKCDCEGCSSKCSKYIKS